MTAEPQRAEVIDLASRRKPSPDVDTTQVMRRRRLPTLPAGVGGVVLAAPKQCVCCLGRGAKAGGDRWGAWVSEKGHKAERTKKTAWWVGGVLVGLYIVGPAGWGVLLAVGTVAALVAGRKKDVPHMEEAASPAPPTVEAQGGTPASPVSPPPLPTAPTSGPVPVGPPSVSPLVGRTQPVDIWTEAVRWGLNAWGHPVETILPGNPGLLTGGVSGSGKSVASHQMLCTVALDPHARLWLVDGKRIELTYYRDIAHAYLGSPDLDALDEMVDDLIEEKDRRLEAIEGKAVKITAKNWRTYDAPFILLHIDEIQIYSMRGKKGQELAEKIGLLATQCRAAGIFVSVSTQRPDDKVVPPFLCNNLTLKLALRTEDCDQSNTVLGKGQGGRGYRSDRFTGDQKGAAYYRGEVGAPISLTTGYLQIPDEDDEGPDHVRDIVSIARELREAAGTLPGSDGPTESLEEAIDRSGCLLVVADALEVLDARDTDRISRKDLAESLDVDGDQLREDLKEAGVCSPHPIAGTAGRGWYRADLEAVMP